MKFGKDALKLVKNGFFLSGTIFFVFFANFCVFRGFGFVVVAVCLWVFAVVNFRELVNFRGNEFSRSCKFFVVVAGCFGVSVVVNFCGCDCCGLCLGFCSCGLVVVFVVWLMW